MGSIRRYGFYTGTAGELPNARDGQPCPLPVHHLHLRVVLDLQHRQPHFLPLRPNLRNVRGQRLVGLRDLPALELGLQEPTGARVAREHQQAASVPVQPVGCHQFGLLQPYAHQGLCGCAQQLAIWSGRQTMGFVHYHGIRAGVQHRNVRRQQLCGFFWEVGIDPCGRPTRKNKPRGQQRAGCVG